MSFTMHSLPVQLSPECDAPCFISRIFDQEMDPVGLLIGVVAPLQRARDAMQGARELNTNLRQRYGDYSAVIKLLEKQT